jgi:hypothetical protein
MIAAILVISLAGAVGSATLCWKYIKPWYLAAQLSGGDGYKRVHAITSCCVAGAFFVGLFGTALILNWFV